MNSPLFVSRKTCEKQSHIKVKTIIYMHMLKLFDYKHIVTKLILVTDLSGDQVEMEFVWIAQPLCGEYLVSYLSKWQLPN